LPSTSRRIPSHSRKRRAPRNPSTLEAALEQYEYSRKRSQKNGRKFIAKSGTMEKLRWQINTAADYFYISI